MRVDEKASGWSSASGVEGEGLQYLARENAPMCMLERWMIVGTKEEGRKLQQHRFRSLLS